MSICIICLDREAVNKKTKDCANCRQRRRNYEIKLRMESWRKKNGLKSTGEVVLVSGLGRLGRNKTMG